MNRKTCQFVILSICLVLLTISLPDLVTAAPERRTALIIGNGGYSSSPLKNPVNDATDIAANLQRLGFTVTLKKNASHKEMEDAIREFGDQLKKGGVGLFFYAGHGVQLGGRNYLLPVGSRIDRDTDVKFYAVDTEIVLAEMGNAGNNLNIVILDACRDNPFGKTFRTGNRGLAIISDAPKGMLITYSTSPGKVAADGSGRNSPYTESLMRHMNTTGLPIEEVFKEVRKELGRKTSGQQVPWELSSLEGQFYFSPGKPVMSGTVAKNDADDETRKLEAEQRRLEEERASFEKKKAMEERRQQIAAERERLAVEQEAERQAAADRKKAALEEKRRKIAAEKERLAAEKEQARQAALERKKAKKKTTLAMAKRPSQPTAGETGRDGPFIAYGNGTVLDTKTNLMWAAQDNGHTINWSDAKRYCENYRGGGYADWRMPTFDELTGLYDSSKSRLATCSDTMIHAATELINITCLTVHTSETRGSETAGLAFATGLHVWHDGSSRPEFLDEIVRSYRRALPVRNAK